MSRQPAPPRLILYGPDDKYGATPKRRFTRYVWYIIWHEGGVRCERSTGTSDSGAAQAALAAFLTERQLERLGDAGPRPAAQISVGEALMAYMQDHAPTVAAPERIAFAANRLAPFWSERPISDVSERTCRAYQDWRKGDGAVLRTRIALDKKTKAPIRVQKPEPPSDSTIRRELFTLGAALNWCVDQGKLIVAPKVWLPDEAPPKDHWLTKSDAARLLWFAHRGARAYQREITRTEDRSDLHLPLFIQIALATGRRRSAILNLAWKPHDGGGHVDLKRGQIDFEGGQRRTNKKRGLIPIPRELAGPLRRARKRTHVFLFERATIDEAGKAVFVPIQSLRRSLSTAAALAGLEDVTHHTLKHTTITWMMQADMPAWKVSAWTATSLATINKIYAGRSTAMFDEFVNGKKR